MCFSFKQSFFSYFDPAINKKNYNNDVTLNKNDVNETLISNEEPELFKCKIPAKVKINFIYY